MATAREIMHLGVECIPAHETLDRAAQVMRNLNVGALPICGENEKLTGILTDRDIVVKCIAVGHDPAVVTAGEMADGPPIWVDASASEEDVLSLMEGSKVRRIPVIHERTLVGMISEADLAQHLSEDKLAHFVAAVTQAPPSAGQQTM
jgi:CBS domain-containing protein